MTELALQIGLHLFIHATLIVGGAWLVVRYWGGSAASKHATWTMAFAVLLLLPLGYGVVPGWTVEVPAVGLDTGVQTVQRGAPVEAVSASVHVQDREKSLDPASSGDASSGVVARNTSTGTASSGQSSTGDLGWTIPPSSFWLATVFLVVWAIGMVLLLARLGIGIITLFRWKRSTTNVGCADLAKCLACELDLDRSFSIRCSPEPRVPVVWGVFSPTILLPDEAMEWSSARLRTVLLHELAHVKRRDHITHVVSRLARAVFWLNPLVWSAYGWAKAVQEQACDDAVLRSGVPAWAYAEQLLDTAKALRHHSSPVEAVALDSGRGFKSRMRALLRTTTPRRSVTHAELGVLLLAGTVLLASCSLFQFGTSPLSDQHRQYWFEAEAASLPSGFAAQEETGASAGTYVEVTQAATMNRPSTTDPVMYSFETARTGRHYVWARVRVPDENHDSFWVQMDSTRWVRWNDIEQGRRWHWVQLRDDDRGKRPVAFDLSEGRHRLLIGRREDEIELDRLLVTSDQHYRPTGSGAEAAPLTDRHDVWLEAEDGWLQSPLRITNAPGASGWKHIEADLGDDDDKRTAAAPDAGHATYSFTVPRAGTYRVWGRVIAPSDDHDSFWVRMDDGPWIRWNGIRLGEQWHWDQVHDADDNRPVDFDLSAGPHQLFVAYREPDVSLDRLLLTSSPTYRPRGTGVPSKTAPVRFSKELSVANATLTPPMVREADSASSWIEVPHEANDSPPEGGPGAAHFTFSVPEGGHYVLWGEVMAPSDESNSFFVSIDGGGEWVWHAPDHDETATRWTWTPVSDGIEDEAITPVLLSLEAGTHKLRIRSREDGTRLRRLRIGNTPSRGTPPVILPSKSAPAQSAVGITSSM